MKAIVLAGGFAKRLWPLTLKTPKPLLKVCGKPILDYIMEKLVPLKEIKEIIITINKRFENEFRTWLQSRGFDNVKLVIEKSMKEEEKPGAIAALKGVYNLIGSEDVLIIAGDNIFSSGLKDFIDFYLKKNAPVIGVYNIGDKSRAKLYANVSIDENNKIINLVEKPKQPISTLVAMCLYILPNWSYKMIDEYLESGGNPDAPGYFIEWLYRKVDVYAFIFSGYWFDIGDFKSLELANKVFKKKAVLN